MAEPCEIPEGVGTICTEIKNSALGKIILDIWRKSCIITHVPDAGVAHPVERHLAKVEVASSSLVTRSIKVSAWESVSWICSLQIETCVIQFTQIWPCGAVG